MYYVLDRASTFLSSFPPRLVAEVRVVRPAQQHGLLATLLDRYKNDFVPDGKHKHTLKMGGNIAKLKPSTIRHLVRNHRIKATLSKLSYDWLGHA